MKFRSENLIDGIEEAKPLLRKHWDEVSHYGDIEFNPDYDQYIRFEELGITRSYSARTEDGILIGYAVFVLIQNPNNKYLRQASQCLLYIDKEHRGIGNYFIQFCDRMLQEEGIHEVIHYLPRNEYADKFMERCGYKNVHSTYSKRIN